MRVTLEIDDKKASFFLELLKSFRDFVRIEQSQIKSSDTNLNPLSFSGIFEDMEGNLFEELTGDLHQNRIRANRVSE